MPRVTTISSSSSSRSRDRRPLSGMALAAAAGLFAFLLGCLATASFSLLHRSARADRRYDPVPAGPVSGARSRTSRATTERAIRGWTASTAEGSTTTDHVRVLVAIASYDFAQLPHLEEVLGSYHDLCLTAHVARVDVVVHATIAWPVTLIDVLNSRYFCANWSLTVALKPPSLRLHLVDCHRDLFVRY